MKKHFIILAVLMTCLLNSCTQDEETVYSCNDAINKWAKENISMIQKMSRNEWNQLEAKKKRAAYVGFTQQQRIMFWHEKLEELKSIDWSQEELAHIMLVGKFIDEHNEFFLGKKLTDEQSDILYRFCYTWIQEGIEKYGWTKATAISIIGTGNTVTDKDGGYTPDPGPNPGSDQECECHADNIVFTICTAGREQCDKADCISTSVGCGFFFSEECNGLCN